MSEFDTLAALLSELETEIKNGGTNGKVDTATLYNKLVDIAETCGFYPHKVTLAPADVYTVLSDPPVIIEAPGADIFLIPNHVIAIKEAGSAYTGTNDVYIKIDTGGNLLKLAATGFLDQTTETIVQANDFGSASLVSNKGVIAESAKDPDASGGSNIIVFVFYRKIDIS